jgi:hypothetical protein
MKNDIDLTNCKVVQSNPKISAEQVYVSDNTHDIHYDSTQVNLYDIIKDLTERIVELEKEVLPEKHI